MSGADKSVEAGNTLLNEDATKTACKKPSTSGLQALRKPLYVITLLAVVLSILLCCLVIVYLTHTNRNTYVADADQFSGEPAACVACYLLKRSNNRQLTDGLLGTLTVVVKEDTRLCCAYNSEQMSALMQLTLLKKEEALSVPAPLSHPGQLRFSPASAHKILHDQKPDYAHNPKYLIPLLVDNTTNTKLEHARGVQVMKDALVVPYDGVYYVYASVEFKTKADVPCNDPQVRGSYVQRFNPRSLDTSGCLMKTAHTCCKTCSEMDLSSQYTGGVFKMKAGDQIFVEVTNNLHVNFRPETTFVGLVMMGGTDENNNKYNNNAIYNNNNNNDDKKIAEDTSDKAFRFSSIIPTIRSDGTSVVTPSILEAATATTAAYKEEFEPTASPTPLADEE